MTTYTIVPNGDGTGFNISIAGSDGARQTMLGFASKAEAEAWIVQDRRLSQVPTPQMSDASVSAYG
jgi:hypothetical protein